MKIKLALHILLHEWRYPRMKWHMFEKTFDAVENRMVEIGRLNGFAPEGYSFIMIFPFVPQGQNTNVFNNSVQFLVYDGMLYVKTFQTESNVKLQFYGVVARG